ncbi:MAG: hypothetical protein LIP77_09880, partial [Planctomycetes bacterium]|nr:hypothetical protein [Planctomycetota bacterium]
AYQTGFDAAYVEMAKGLMTPDHVLTDHGRAVAEFHRWRRENPPRGDWRTPPAAAATVRRFPSGNPGGKLPAFLDARSYGSRDYRFRTCLPGGRSGYCGMDNRWWRWFMENAADIPVTAPEDFAGTTFNSVPFSSRLEAFSATTLGRPYRTTCGLPATDFVDHTAPLPPAAAGLAVDLYRP